MTVKATSPALNLRALLNKLAGIKPAPRTATFWRDGDTSTTTFALPSGWRVREVYVSGALFRPGTGEDYTTTLDMDVQSVVFAVAPAAVDIAIQAEEVA